MNAIGDQAAEAESFGPNWVRSEHPASEFNEAATRKVRQVVPELKTLDRVMIRGTTAQGMDVILDFRTRMNGGLVFEYGIRKARKDSFSYEGFHPQMAFDVDPKDYKPGTTLARFRTMVHTTGLPNMEAVRRAKEAVEELLRQ